MTRTGTSRAGMTCRWAWLLVLMLVQLIGESRRLRDFFAARQILLADAAASLATSAIVFTEENIDDRRPLADSVNVVVHCREAADAMLAVIAKPMGRGWLVEACRPHFEQLKDTPEAENELALILRFVDQLTPAPTPTPSTP